MKKTLRAVSVILSLFAIITLTYPSAWADLPQADGQQNTENAAIVKQLGNLPAFFIENQGQTAGEARYYFKGNDTVYFTDEAVVFQKTGNRDQEGRGTACRAPTGRITSAQGDKGQGAGDREDSEIRNPNSESGKLGDREGQQVQSLSYKLEFVGANATSPQARNELEGKVNYFIGTDHSQWHTNIPTYQEIVYPGVYGKTGARDQEGRGTACRAPTGRITPAQGDKGLGDRENNVACELASHAGGSGIVGQPSVPDELARYSEAGGTIDLIYKGVPGGMKYEFMVHPGANPSDIRLAYTGIDGLSIDDSGNLIVHTALGDVKDDRPYAYQEIDGQRVEVECRFIMESSDYVAGKSIDTVNGLQKTGSPVILTPNEVKGKNPGAETLRYAQGDKHPEIPNPQFVYGFEVASYDENYPLVIDPGLSYSTFLGGGAGDQGGGIAVDASGNAYVTGSTYSSNFPTTLRAFDTSHNGGSDAFVTKLNPTGSALSYSTFLGGSSDDYGSGIALDASGNAHVTGWTYSTDFPTTPGAFDTSYNGNGDAFVTRLYSSGSALGYSTFLGGAKGWDLGQDIAVSGSHNAYVIGMTRSDDFPTLPGSYDTHLDGVEDVFVTKIGKAGSNLVYSTFLGGSADEMGIAIALDASNNAYVTGKTSSTDFPTTPGAFDMSYNVGTDAFVTKLDPVGKTLICSTFLGGVKYDSGFGIAVDASGNVYVIGDTESKNFPVTRGAFDTGYNGDRDVFVTKLNPTCSSLIYSTFLGGSAFDSGDGIVLDGLGNAYVAGGAFSSNFPTTRGAYNTSYNGNGDAFVAKLNPIGSSLIYSTFLGGSSADWGQDIVVDAKGNAFVTGFTSSSGFPTTPGAFDTSLNGEDAFVTKLPP